MREKVCDLLKGRASLVHPILFGESKDVEKRDEVRYFTIPTAAFRHRAGLTVFVARERPLGTESPPIRMAGRMHCGCERIRVDSAMGIGRAAFFIL